MLVYIESLETGRNTGGEYRERSRKEIIQGIVHYGENFSLVMRERK